MRGFAVLFLGILAFSAFAQDAKKEIQRYQRMIAEGSPVELFELEGEALWKKPDGPSKVSLQTCDLGLGAGVLRGAYARLPRYFADGARIPLCLYFRRSRGIKMAPGTGHPKEKEAFALGQKLFFHRAGSAA